MDNIDIWQNALKKINLNEGVQFISRGVLVTETSQVELYNKIQALLNCPEMISSHRFLYSLDPEELTEAEATKVCNLYKLGQDRGLLEPDDTEEDSSETKNEVAAEITTTPIQSTAIEPTSPVTVTPVQALLPASTSQCAYTVLYSAMRNGNITTGEAYSNAINPRSAKADVISQLEKVGYSNISILAIECGDPECCGETPNTYVKQPEQNVNIPDYSDSEDGVLYTDNDMLQNRNHNLHINEKDVDKNEEDNTKSDDDNQDSTNTDKTSTSDSTDEKTKDAPDEDSTEKKETSDTGDKKEDIEEPDEKIKGSETEEKAETAKDDKDKKELTKSEKTALSDSYKKAFKAAMIKCKFFDKKFEDLTLEQKIDFFTVLSTAWGDKADPSKFMSDKEIDQLEKIVVKK